jgi:hypothetical protein
VDTLFRLDPQMPAAAYKTYSLISPGRPATCEEVDCEQFRSGWRIRVEELSPELLRSARNSGRRFQELRVADGETWLVFDAGQSCFARHSLPWEGRERFIERGGDWRGNPRGDRYEHNADTWVDSFANHQQKLADRLEQG